MEDLNITNYFVSDEFFHLLRKVKDLYGEEYCNANMVQSLTTLAIKYLLINKEFNGNYSEVITKFLNDYIEEDAKLISLNENWNDRSVSFNYDGKIKKYRIERLIEPMLKKYGFSKIEDLDVENQKKTFQRSIQKFIW